MPETKLLVSVIITAFNEEKNLPRCLKALKDQEYPKDRYEVIVVDNNSTDKTAEVAGNFGAKVISEKKQGYVYALRHGMDEARGDIIAVTDSDTKVAKNWLSVIERVFVNPKVVGATGLIEGTAKTKLANRLMEIGYSIPMYASALVGRAFLVGFNFAVRKDAYIKAGRLNTEYEMSPDVELGIKLGKLGKIKIVDDMLVCTSTRRWKSDGIVKTFLDYCKGYFYSVWLRKPPPVKQSVIR
jgi:glycosyltransferase involved in cell wall biosynthesis